MKARRIPETTIAALVLGGCGSGSDSSASLASTICTSLQRCDPDEFEYQYDSFRECIREVERDFAEVSDFSARCEAAYTAFLQCFYDAYADTCSDYASNRMCEREVLAAYDACEGMLDFPYY